MILQANTSLQDKTGACCLLCRRELELIGVLKFDHKTRYFQETCQVVYVGPAIMTVECPHCATALVSVECGYRADSIVLHSAA